MKSNYKIVVITNKGKNTVVAAKFGTAQETCHQAKSLAGSMFHSPCVIRVRVKDALGRTFLVLDKNSPRENFNVPSEFAQLV